MSAGVWAPQPATAVDFAVPPDACDTHTHIHGDLKQFALSPARVYTPGPATPDEMRALHRALHIKRVVIVTPSVFGSDNAVSVYGMEARGADARGVAVIDDKMSEAAIDALHAAGMRGLRINLLTVGVEDPAVGRKRYQDAVARAAKRNWHVQLYTSLPVIAAIKDLVLAAPVPAVFDHFGGAHGPAGLGQPGFSDLVELLRAGKAYVKISGAYRVSANAPDYPDAAPLAKALIAANPERILWGTDWPHPNSTPPGKKPTDLTPAFAIDDGRLMNQLALWAPDAGVRRQILVDNPARLYGF